MQRRTAGPCPFCRSSRLAERVCHAATSPASPTAGALVVALEHEVGCPRRQERVETTPGEEMSAFQAYLESEFPPGEREPLRRGKRGLDVGVLLGRNKGGRTSPDLLARLCEATAELLPKLPEAPDPRELACALLALSCHTAEAADASFLPPIFLAAFFPTLGLSEAEAIGLLRYAFADHRRLEEAAVEAARQAQIHDEAKELFDAQFRSRN